MINLRSMANNFVSFYKKYLRVFYLLVFILMILGALMPLPYVLRLLIFILFVIGVHIFCLEIFIESILISDKIYKIILWLLFMPFIISLVLIGYIMDFWKGYNSFIVIYTIFIIVFVFSWMLASY